MCLECDQVYDTPDVGTDGKLRGLKYHATLPLISAKSNKNAICICYCCDIFICLPVLDLTICSFGGGCTFRNMKLMMKRKTVMRFVILPVCRGLTSLFFCFVFKISIFPPFEPTIRYEKCNRIAWLIYHQIRAKGHYHNSRCFVENQKGANT